MSSIISRIAIGLAATLLSTVPLAANAQTATHIGNGQALRLEADVLNLIDVGVASSLAGNQPIAGSNFAVGPEARAGNVSALGLNLGGLTSGVVNFLSVNASALSATSVGGNGQVFSSANVASVGANTPSTNLSVGLSVPGVLSVPFVTAGYPAVSLSNFLTLKAIRTETFANINGLRTSKTIIEGLAVRNGTGAFVTLNNSLLGLGATGTTALNGTVNLEFDESDGVVGFAVTGVGGGNLASILLHEKVNNADGSRTTNGIHVSLLNGALTSGLANADLFVASSTAGVSAPEPGSLSLLVMALSGGIVVRTRRRGKRAGIMHSKP